MRAVVTLDALTYAGRGENLGPALDDPRHVFVYDDACDAPLVRSLFDTCDIDPVVHFAAESHVDRSITGPAAFIATNVVGTFTLLEAARAYGRPVVRDWLFVEDHCRTVDLRYLEP